MEVIVCLVVAAASYYALRAVIRIEREANKEAKGKK